MSPRLFQPLVQRGVRLRNRIGVSPMCTYSAEAQDGLATAWHVAHLGARAIGGAGLVMTEATAVEAAGRISPQDLGIWADQHVDALRPVAAAIAAAGAVPGIQLAHAGRKASTHRPWARNRGRVPRSEGGWTPVGPTAEPFQPGDGAVTPLEEPDLHRLIVRFAEAAERAVAAGFRLIEVHGAHGYLIHSFLSPLANSRTDAWGGPAAARERLALAAIEAVRAAVPASVPIWLRLSASDWTEGGWQSSDTVRLAGRALAAGADLIDCSSGGIVPGVRIPVGANYQVPFAQAVKRAGVPSAAVGAISEPAQAEAIVRDGQADFVLLGKQMLREPHWTLRAAAELGAPPPWPEQYAWAVGST